VMWSATWNKMPCSDMSWSDHSLWGFYVQTAWKHLPILAPALIDNEQFVLMYTKCTDTKMNRRFIRYCLKSSQKNLPISLTELPHRITAMTNHTNTLDSIFFIVRYAILFILIKNLLSRYT
jgi:hypothetical protein